MNKGLNDTLVTCKCSIFCACHNRVVHSGSFQERKLDSKIREGLVDVISWPGLVENG